MQRAFLQALVQRYDDDARVVTAHPVVAQDHPGGKAPADFVRVFRPDGSGEHWGQVLPGEELSVCLCTADPGQLRVTLAWYRWRTDDEYCWAFTT